MFGNIKIDVNISEFENLEYNTATIDPIFHKKYIAADHKEEQMILYNYYEPNPMPAAVDVVRNHFNFLKPLSIAVNLCKPGQYLPLHSDMYKRWMEVFNISDVSRIYRYIVMLEDSEPGQLLQIEDDVYTTWKAGDYISWSGYTKHAIYNMSLKNRYALQLTGYR